MNPTNIKPFIYVGILAVAAVAGLGYYLMPEKVVYEPISVLDDASKESDTPVITQPSTPQNPNPVVTPTPTPNPIPAPVACTMDAMMCPDGSYVGRSGPNCQFVCPNSSSEIGFKYNEFSDFEITFPAEYKEIADKVETYSGINERVILYNTNGVSKSQIPRVAEMTIMVGDYSQPYIENYSNFYSININNRAFQVYSSECRGDIYGCQLTRYATKLKTHTVIFDVVFKASTGEIISPAEQESHLSRIRINEK